MGDDVRATQQLAIARDISPKAMNKMKKLIAADEDASMQEVSALSMEEG